MKKINQSATALLLAVTLFCSIFIIAPIANADEEMSKDSHFFDSFVTSVDITYTDNAGQHTSTLKDSGNPDIIEIKSGTTVGLKYYFSIPDNQAIDSGDQCTMSLPSNLPVTPAFQGKTGTIGLLGTYQISHEQTVTMTFNEYAAAHDQRGGYVYVETSFSGASGGGQSPGSIVFYIQGNAIQIPVETVYTVVNPTVNKSGNIDASGIITWTVTVHSGNDKNGNGLSGACVTDTPGSHQDVDSSSYKVKIGSDSEQQIKDSGSGVPYYEVNDGNTVFHIGDVPANTDAVITYQTKVTNDIYRLNQDTAQITNTAKLSADNVTVTPSANASITAPIDWIEKSGNYDSVSGKIEWTITVNPQQQHLPAGATVTDALAQYLNLDEASVQVNGSSITTSTSDPVYYGTTASSGKTTITLHFTQAIDDTRIITFTTAVDPAYYNTNTNGFTNKASLTTPNTASDIGKTRTATTGTIGPSSTILTKTPSGSYNASTHQLKWAITVDTNKIAIANPVVTDTIDKQSNGTIVNRQKIVSVTATQNGSHVTLNQGTAQNTGVTPYYFISEDENTLTVHLNDFQADDAPTILTVTSEVTAPSYYAVNATNPVYNTAVLTGTSSSGNINQSVTANQNVASQVIAKTALGTYDYSNRLLGWKIAVNQNAMPMQNAVITDTIPTGLTLSGNVTVGGSTIPQDTPASAGQPYYTLDGSNLLTVYLGDISASKTVQYATTVNLDQFKNSNQSLLYSNTAKLRFANGTGSEITSTATQTVTNSIVEKGYKYKSGTLYIDWQVLINRNQVQIGKGEDTTVTIADSIPQGLSLDTSSVALYPVTVTNNGKTFSNGAAISLTKDNINYNVTTGAFVFTFSKNLDLSKAYRLEFRTFVTDKSKGPFQNTVSFQGIVKDQSSTSGNVVISYQAADGDGWGSLPLGSITVLKQDSKDNTPLSGAEFTLYDSYGNPVQVVTTNASGQALFSRLSYATYSLRETKTPIGYEKSTYYMTGVQVSATSKNVALTVQNTKLSPSSSSASSSASSTSSESSSSTAPNSSNASSESSSSAAPSSSTASSEVSSFVSSSNTTQNHSHNGVGSTNSSSSSSSFLPPSSSNPNENIGDNQAGRAGPGSSSRPSKSMETIGDDGVGLSGATPKTGENHSEIPVLTVLMSIAAAVFVILRRKRTRQ